MNDFERRWKQAAAHLAKLPGDDAAPFGFADGHEDGLGDGGAALVERGVGDLHAGELADERLELEERLQAALARLRLVGRVGGVELAPPRDRVHDGGDEVVIRPAAEEAYGVCRRAVARR